MNPAVLPNLEWPVRTTDTDFRLTGFQCNMRIRCWYLRTTDQGALRKIGQLPDPIRDAVRTRVRQALDFPSPTDP